MSLGLEGALGTQAIGTTLEDVFAQRLKAAALQVQQQDHLAQQALEQKKLAQDDAYHRLAMQEAAERIKQQAKAQAEADELKQHAQAEKDYGLIPPNTPLSPQTASRFAAHGIAPELMPKEPISNEAIQPPAGIMALGTPAAGPMPGTMANSPAPSQQRQIRGLTAIEAQQKAEGDAQEQLANDPNTDPTVRKFLQLRRILPKGENPPAELFKDPNAAFNEHTRTRDYDIKHPLPHTEPTVVIQTPSGPAIVNKNTNTATPITDDGGNALGPKDPNQEQYTAGAYAGRMEQAETQLGALERTIAGMPYLSYEAQSRLPARGQSKEMQSYIQASRNFINAVLRRESGAAISASEFDNARAQYLPQPGDAPETLAQKKANREYVSDSMKRAAGRGYVPAKAATDGKVTVTRID